MKKALTGCVVAVAALTALWNVSAQDIKLPPPQKTGGKSLMECMTLRKSSRNFDPKALPSQILSNLMYAADGINRKDGRKTVPTARNFQPQTIYVAMASGLYLYEPKTHTLKQISKDDVRKYFGSQPFHKVAPVDLVYVGDLPRIGSNQAEQALYAGNHAGYASQNVYLYAASEGLATVVCGMLDRKQLAKILKLRKGQWPIYSQPVGYPAK